MDSTLLARLLLGAPLAFELSMHIEEPVLVLEGRKERKKEGEGKEGKERREYPEVPKRDLH